MGLLGNVCEIFIRPLVFRPPPCEPIRAASGVLWVGAILPGLSVLKRPTALGNGLGVAVENRVIEWLGAGAFGVGVALRHFALKV